MKLFGGLRNNFFAGLVAILPIILTILIIRFLFVTLNRILLEPIVRISVPYLAQTHLVIVAKSIAFLLALVIITIIGFMTRWLLAKRIFLYLERLLLKIPLMNKIYSGIKEISHAFLGEKSKMFRKVVLVEYPRKGVYSLGFIASEAKGEIQEKTNKEVVNVFVPTAPNPTSGVLLMVPVDDVRPLEMSVEEGLKLVVSGGVLVPPYEK
jgi:uncharacterized membrane protein